MCLYKKLDNINYRIIEFKGKLVGMKHFIVSNSLLRSAYLSYTYKFKLHNSNLVSVENNTEQPINYEIGKGIIRKTRIMGYHLTSFSQTPITLRKDCCKIPVFFEKEDIQDMDSVDVVVEKFSLMSVKDFNKFVEYHNEEAVLGFVMDEKCKKLLKKEYSKLYRAIKKEVENA